MNEETERWAAVYIRTKHDTNGNPRRGWVIQKDGHLVTFLDEGYEGHQAAQHRLMDIMAAERVQGYALLAIELIQEALAVQVPPSEYALFKRHGKAVDKEAGR